MALYRLNMWTLGKFEKNHLKGKIKCADVEEQLLQSVIEKRNLLDITTYTKK